MLDWSEHRVLVTGGTGFLGGWIRSRLAERGAKEVLSVGSGQCDLTRQSDVERLYDRLEPDVVIHAAAHVGGIGAHHEHPGRFFYANTAMGLHLVEAARRHKIRKFVFVGSACAYPKFARVPVCEGDLWDGYPEETTAPYGIAKKAMFVMLDAYRRQYGLPSAVVVPGNLYGPGDNFAPPVAHVIPALVRRCVDAARENAASITCWGTGRATREFLYAADAADGVLAAAETMEEPIPINLGTGREMTIASVVEIIAAASGFVGGIRWDTDKPDGQPRRCLDVSRARDILGWEAETSFETGIARTVDWFKAQA